MFFRPAASNARPVAKDFNKGSPPLEGVKLFFSSQQREYTLRGKESKGGPRVRSQGGAEEDGES